MSNELDLRRPDGLAGNQLYLMPACFGGLSYPLPAARYRDCTHLTISYCTDATQLQALLPPGFRLSEPRLIVTMANNRSVDWLAGAGYNILAVNVPVTFTGRDGDVEGVFGLVVWENKTAPILMGREAQGVPKLFASVSDLRNFPPGNWSASAHVEGSRFARLSISGLQPLSGVEMESFSSQHATANWFGWRYIPNVGAPGAALSHPVLFPQEFSIRSASLGSGSVEWTVPDWPSNPTQAHIIAKLASLPNHGGEIGFVMECENILRADQATVPA